MSAPASAALAAGVLARYGDELYHCASCNYCVDQVWPERGIARVCATFEHHAPSPAYSGRGYIEIARALAEGMELDLDTVAVRVNTCTDCGNCEVTCPIGLHPAAINRGLRTALYEAGAAPAAIATAVETITTRGNVRAAPAVIAERATGTGPRMRLYVGCHADEDGTALLGWLAAGGVEVSLVRDARACCGAALAELGAGRSATAWRDDARAAVDAGTVVLGYECLRHLQDGDAAGPQGLLGWLVAALDGGELTLALRRGVVPSPLHLLESCQLKPRPGRAAPAEEACARNLLERLGVPLANTGFPNRFRLCCGAGGGMPAVQPEAAARMAAARADAAGAVAAVTLDPRCARHFADAGRAVGSFAAWLVEHCELTATTGERA